MDKNAIKKYAVWARNELIARVSQKALQYGITENNIVDAASDSINGKLLTDIEKKQRQALIEQIKEKGFEQVIEEVAYTWFNRFSAIRFMEVNSYLPSHVRVFTDEENNFKPQIITEAIHLEMDGLDMEKVYAFKEADKTEDLYKYLLITQCNALNKILPGMFQHISDYSELLLPDNLLREGSVIEQMISLIPEENFDISSEGQVEIIGWLYQYYVSEKHDEVVNVRNKKAISKEDVPAATQIFTTDWVVRYMVDNSLGKYWIAKHKNSMLKESLEYYIPTEEKIDVIGMQDDPSNIRFLDPCMGSGHILVYAFDVLIRIYEEYGYSDRDAAKKIVENNLFGLDIDDRAVQLAYFSVMMKARQYDRRFLTRNVQPNLYAICESNHLDGFCVDYFTNNNDKLKSDIQTLINEMHDAKEYGSLLKISSVDFNTLFARFEEIVGDINLMRESIFNELLPFVRVAKLMSQQYTVVCTNPPYHNKYSKKLEAYMNKYYSSYSGDMFSAFIVRNFEYCQNDGFSALMTPHVWMFIKSYEALRKYIISNKSVSTLIHMAKGAFYSEAAVDICSVVFRNSSDDKLGRYMRLEEFKGNMDIQREKVLEGIKQKSCDYLFDCELKNFERIDGNPFSYWVSEMVYEDFEKGRTLKSVAPPRQGMATTNNDRFLKLWFEVAYSSIGFNMGSEDESADSGKKYFPYNKGGEFRRWYGNNFYVINFQNHGKELCDYIDVTAAPKFNHKNRVINRDYYFKECITWADISADFSGRYCPKGFIFDIKGSCGFPPQEKLLYVLGLLNSKLTQNFINILNPTISTQVGDMSRIPVLYDNVELIEAYVEKNVGEAKEDWDSSEISWDYKKHPYLLYLDMCDGLIEQAQKCLEEETERRFSSVKENEQKINELFISNYGLQGEISPDVHDDGITIKKADRMSTIINFISYAVGCMFGRYALGTDGLAYAGGVWDDSISTNFSVDKDNIIPICDDEYFPDDIVGRFVSFVGVVFGKDHLEANLQYIADIFSYKGASREILRQYFVNDFYKDHCTIFSARGAGKRPIYWQFDSGKKNGFKCLIYMHRYQPDTIARIRTDYVHEQQSRYRTAIADLEQRINGASTSDRVKLNKQLTKLKDQDTELRDYEEKIHHLADQMIRIDLDDGVKNNYEIFKDVLAKIK